MVLRHAAALGHSYWVNCLSERKLNKKQIYFYKKLVSGLNCFPQTVVHIVYAPWTIENVHSTKVCHQAFFFTLIFARTFATAFFVVVEIPEP